MNSRHAPSAAAGTSGSDDEPSAASDQSSPASSRSKYSDPEARQRACARKGVPSAAFSSTSVSRPLRNLSIALGFSASPPESPMDDALEVEGAVAAVRARLRGGIEINK